LPRATAKGYAALILTSLCSHICRARLLRRVVCTPNGFTGRAALLFSASVIPTGVAGLFFRAVCGAPATEWRDHGNQLSQSQLDEITQALLASCYLLTVLLSQKERAKKPRAPPLLLITDY
jgi:hypothetical protein